MRVLLITPNYVPDLGPSASLFAMLSEDLAKMGHDVSVIAAVPHYPTGKVPPEFRGKVFRSEKLNGVNVTRVWVPSINRANLKQRMLAFICYQTLATLAGMKQKYDVLIASNPGLVVGLPLLLLGVIRKKPVIFSVHDIYPEVGVSLGVFKYRWIIKLVDRIEHFCLNNAAYVRVLSEGFRKTFNTKGFNDSKIVLIWDWVDTNFIKPLPRSNDFSRQFGLGDSFIVMYAGNIGYSQGLEIVVETARLLTEYTEIRLIFVGDGAGKEHLQKTVEHFNVTNVQFIPFQSRELLPLVMASADISLINLKKGVSSDSVPSKFYSILASGRPVIAAVDKESDTCNLINKSQCGICIEPEDPQALAEAILYLYQNSKERDSMGNNGRSYVVKNHSSWIAAQKFAEVIAQVVKKKGNK